MQAGDLVSGKYRLLRLLGQGGMGSVWAVRNELTDRDFAVKFLYPRLAENKEALNRFFLEARACGQIKHPAVVDVYDMGQAEDGSPYLVMELLEGEGFDQRLGRAGCFRPAEAAAWIAFISRGLEEAHVRGLVHRDLKPGNIFFALDDRGDVIPKILDFGISKATNQNHDFFKTNTGAVLGSPAYMSPEQARGDTDVDSRSDVWSLGVILYEALTGRPPFDAANYNALMVAIITQEHKPVIQVAAGVPTDLSQIIDQALAKDRTKRISTARELADRLEAVAARSTDAMVPLYGMRTPTLIGASTIPRSTTQNAWSEGSTASRARGMNTAIAATLLASALVVGGLVAWFRMQPPLVAVAKRSSLALTASMTRLNVEMDRVKADVEAQKTKPVAPTTTAGVDPSDLPPAGAATTAPSAKPTASGKPGGKPAASSNAKKDPFGVAGPGF